MRHLFAKELKERRMMKLVKKLQQEEDETWYVEQQRRLEQEEKDAAFARELQEQIAYDERSINSDGMYATSIGPPSSTNSPVMSTLSHISSSPPPIPAKPTAYYSSSLSSSSSSTTQRVIPPPTYQNGQPPLPPRERTVSQLSHYNSSQQSTHKPDDCHDSPNPATLEIGYHPSYYPGTTQHFHHRDPVMFIIPQEATTNFHNNTFYQPATMSMPEPDRNISLQYSTTPPYDPSPHSLGGTSNTAIGMTFATQAPQNQTTTITSAPTSYRYQPIAAMKPDANLEDEDDHPYRSALINETSTPQQQITTDDDRVEETDDDDDDDDIESMFWECNDGRMMASTSSNSTNHKNDDKSNRTSQATQNEKHLTTTNDPDEEGFVSDGDDIVIDPIDITENDHVIIHQHNSITHSVDDNNNDDDGNPFTDYFAVETTSHQPCENTNKYKTDAQLPTNLKVHDPLQIVIKSPHPGSASLYQDPIHHDLKGSAHLCHY